MSYLERALRYRRVHGTRKLLREGVLRVASRLGLMRASKAPGAHKANAGELVAGRFRQCSPLRVFTVNAPGQARISLVTDSINKGSLYGGVGTALILGVLIAEARGARLRIVTRTERAQPSNLASVLSPYGLHLSREVEFAYAPFDGGEADEIDRIGDELFITTSWWTTASTMASVPPASILYLLQEDERMFYPHGDDHLRCSHVLSSPGIRLAINSKLLYDHLCASGLDNVRANGRWFEPAFPASVFHPRLRDRAGKRVILFYARPNNARNLFHFGLQVLEAAVLRGVLDPHDWEFVFVGRDIPKVQLGGTVEPRVLQDLPWAEYAELVGRVDLGLCLMYTPHPSYPPLDLAASGAVAVTNQFGNKHDLSSYSANILCAKPILEDMLAALREGAELACNDARREANFRANGLQRDWKATFAPLVLQYQRDDVCSG